MKYQPKHSREKFIGLPKTPYNIWKTLYYQVHRRLPNSTVTVNGSKFKATPYRELERAFITGSYEPYDIAFLRYISPEKPYMIDIGANIGFYTIEALNCLNAQRVVAIEPSKRESDQILLNTRLNGFTQELITLRVACSNYNGPGRLNVATGRHCGANSLGNYYYEDTPHMYRETVNVFTLDHIVENLEFVLPRVDIIKVDVEGCEFEVLKGAEQTLLTHKPILVVEYPNQEIVEYLSSLGYYDISPKETRNNFFVKDPERWMNLKN